ncbi:MAG: ATP-binding protein [Myxococcota bacterium]
MDRLLNRSGDPEQDRRAYLTANFSLVGMSIAALFFVVELLKGNYALVGMLGLTITLCAAVLFFLRRFRSPDLAANILCGIFFTMLMAMMPLTGGLLAPGNFLLPPTLVATLLILGPRWVWFWAGVLILFTLWQLLGVERWPSEMQDAPTFAVTIMMGILETVIFANISDAARRSAFDQITRAQDGLQIEHAALREAKEIIEQQAAAMRMVLDTVDQGLLILDEAGKVTGRRSAAAGRWLGHVADQAAFADVLSRLDPTIGRWFALGWEEVGVSSMPLVLLLSQLPSELPIGARRLRIEYSPIRQREEDEEGIRVLVILTDITDELARKKADEEQAQQLSLFNHMRESEDAVRGFLEDTRRNIDDVIASRDMAQTMRLLHTIKGNTALFGVNVIRDLAHELEDAVSLQQAPLQAWQAQQLCTGWDAFMETVRPWIADRGGKISLNAHHFDAIIQVAEPRLARELQRLRLQSMVERLQLMDDRARHLGEQLGKGDIRVLVDVGDLYVHPDRLEVIWSALSHLVRNAVDHGLESEAASGRPPTLRLGARADGDTMVLQVRDNGRGIHWERVAEKAAQHGLPNQTRDQLVEALFSDGLSTRAQISVTSGRGVGLAAVRAAVDELGGWITVDSAPGLGTTVSLYIPLLGVEGESWLTREAA